jgi:LPXTG-motif cell wall-anchored protein
MSETMMAPIISIPYSFIIGILVVFAGIYLYKKKKK